MAQALKKHAAADATIIPDRLYFKIGDVARICGVETYVLRFWETQFPHLRPNKSGTGQRLYRRREVELALEIKRLVHAEGYTIAGAKQVLETSPRPQAARAAAPAQLPVATPAVSNIPAPQTPTATTTATPQHVAAAIGHARAELRELAAMLASPEPSIDPRSLRPRAKLLRVRQDSDQPLFPF